MRHIFSLDFSSAFVSVLLLILSGNAFSQGDLKGLEFRNAATHDELSQRLKMARQNSPMGHLEMRDVEEDKKIAAPSGDFVKDSEIISYNGNLTFVPKGAVLNLPERFESRLVTDEKAKIKTFSEFSVLNRGWITTYEVDIETAFGKKPFDPAKIEWMKNSGRLIIATYKGGAISVLPYTEPDSATANTATEQ
ncbi:MAG: hypothetical protein P1U68_04765 [Verrucomicrobiales bacterium]|nr:hypothetical protein [Verrucomicrobiales bacterium]